MLWPRRGVAASGDSGPVRDVEPGPLGQDDLPWQRADASLPDGCERIEVDGGAALFRITDGNVGVAQLAAGDVAVASELLCAMRARGERLGYANVPEGDPASIALRELGGRLDLRQLEMELTRSSSATRC